MAKLVNLGVVELKDTGMDLRGVAYGDLEDAFDVAVKIKNVGAMAIGALVYEGRRVFSADQITQAITSRNVGEQTAERYARVWEHWRNYEWAHYLEQTSFTHLDAVYTLPIEKRRELLDAVIKDDLPRESLRQMVREEKDTPPKPPKKCPHCGGLL